MTIESCSIARRAIIVCWVLFSTPQLTIAGSCHTSSGSSLAAGSSKHRFICPAHGILVTSCWNLDDDKIILAVRSGAPVYAAADGIVSFAGVLRDYGPTIAIRHAGGFSSLYGHLGNLTVQRGERVEAGRVIATADGSPGAELFFQLLYSGKAVTQRHYVRCQ